MDLGEDNWNEIGDDIDEPGVGFDNEDEFAVARSARDPGTDFVDNPALRERNNATNEWFPDVDFAEEARPYPNRLQPQKRKSDYHPLDYYIHVEPRSSLKNVQVSKKAKLEEKVLDKMMEQINAVKAAKKRSAKLTSTETSLDGQDPETSTAKIHALPPQNAGNWIPVTGSGTGRRFYLVTKQRGLYEASVKALDQFGKESSGTLLGKEYLELKVRAMKILADRKQRQQMLREEAELNASAMQHLESISTAPLDTLDVPADRIEPPAEQKPDELWVEKYKPRLFTDLLSDDGINRTLLTWLKLWDECVFNRPIVRREKKAAAQNQLFNAPSSSSPSSAPDKSQGDWGQKSWDKGKGFSTKFSGTDPSRFAKKKWKFQKKAEADLLSTDLDKHKRPQIKIALLCGSPGLGKTTLAHVIARHAGYHVMEMNASDDRSIEAFREGISKATQFKTTLDSDPRPNCLIIDEIDGAPAPTVNYLVELMKGTAKTGTGKKAKFLIVRRPIICICNDLYAPALRELRKIALVLNFPVTSGQRLTERLSLVCKREKLKAELKTLDALCNLTSQDIRACLNTLQFIANNRLKDDASQANSQELDENSMGSEGRRGVWSLSSEDEGAIKLKDIESSALGQKDAHRTLFDVWQKIFQLPAPNKKKTVSEGNAPKSALSERFDSVYWSAIACGEEEKVRGGIFDNYLRIKEKDPRMNSTNRCVDWLIFADRLSSIVMRIQYYQLMGYTPYIPVVFHLNFAEPTYPKVQFPHSQHELHMNIQKSQNVMKTLLDGADVSVRSFTDTTSLITETLPFVRDIIKPDLRPVNTQLYSAKEKTDLASVVSVMLHYNLTYRQQRNADGQFAFVLEPEVESVVKFPDIQSTTELTSSAKQMIAREAAIEKVRRSANAVTDSSEPATSKAPVDPAAKRPLTSPAGTAAKMTTNHLQYLKPKETSTGPAKKKEKAGANFFAPRSSTLDDMPLENAGFKGTGVWFKYHEGASCAVKRNIRMRDLL